MTFATPRASVIVPAYNAAATVRECLTAIAAQEIDGAFEVILVDDGSSDGTGAIAEECGVRVLRQAHSNPAVARNLGARSSSGEILVFTDADCAPPTGWLARMLAPFADPTVAGVKGAYLTRQRSLLARFIQSEVEEKYDRLRCLPEADFIDTYSAAYRRDVFFDNDGFDEGYPGASAEDVEFSFRVAQRGYYLIFAPDARTYHYHNTDPRQYLRKKFRYGIWRSRLYRRYPGKATGGSRTPRWVPVQILAAGAFTLGLPLFVNRRTRPLPLLAGAVFLAAALPSAVRAGRRDPIVGLISPAIIFARALAQFSGLTVGTVDFLVKQLTGRVNKE